MRSLLSAFVLLILASGAYAQSVDAPRYSVGDTWTIRADNNTRAVKVLKVGADGSVDILGYLSTCPTCTVQLDPRLTILAVLDGTGKPAEPTQIGFVPLGPQWQLLSWPLEPKKRWGFSATAFLRGATETYDLSNRVEKIEDVKTPAGTFKTYKIVRDWLLRARTPARNRDIRWQTTVWFAPEVKFFAKTTTTSTAPGAQDQELIAYSIK